MATLERDPVALVIMLATLVALGLRAYYLSRPGFLFGVTEYDDGPYFGSAVRLVQGIMPYRDFVLVQPPGITLLMVPAALLAKVTGTAWGMATGRVLTALAGTAGVPLMGRLVRHRGVFATLVTCGLLAVFPDSVSAAHTVLVEPWLVLFCLIGAVLVFRDDGLDGSRRHLLAGGLAFGFAGVIEAWAVVPVLVVLVLCLADPGLVYRGPRDAGPTASGPAASSPDVSGRGMSGPGVSGPGASGPAGSGGGGSWLRWARDSRLRRAWPFAAGVAAGFCVPVLPFAASAPRGFYRSLIVAQVGPRSGSTRVPLVSRLVEMTGLSDIRLPVHVLGLFKASPGLVVWIVTVVVVLLAVGVPALLNLVTGEPPTALEWFALGSTELVVVMFLWPVQFHYHFADFLAPFLVLAIALPGQRLIALRSQRATPPTAGGAGGPAKPAGGPVAEGGGSAAKPAGGRLAWAARLPRLPGVATGAAAILLVLFTVVQVRTESALTPVVGPSAIAQGQRIIPPGACVVSDSAALLLLADRFVSAEPGCGVIDDGLGTDLALSQGLTPATGAANVRAVAQLWAQAFEHAQFVWFSDHSWRRVAWAPWVLAYFQQDFKPVLTDSYGDTLYRRTQGRPT